MIRRLFAITIILLSFYGSPPSTFAQASCPVLGSVEETVEGLNKLLSENIVSDCTKSIVDPTNPASREKATIGEINPNKPRSGLLDFGVYGVTYALNTKPVSSKEYIADLFNNIGVPAAQPAYAQTGIGFNALTPVLPLWKAFRNLAYLLYIIIFVVIGFMIMFRQKIDPQTVVSIQSALPRLVITLVLITFSYAIAGLLIDLIYVGIYAAAFLFQFSGIFTEGGAQTVINRLLNENLYMIIFRGQNFLQTAPADAVGEIVGNLLEEGLLQDLFSWGVSSVVSLIIGLALTITVFKLLWILGIGFIKIILAVIFAPMSIMLNAMPGSQAFSNWIRGILANVAMFPAIAIMFMIGAALMGSGYQGNNPLVGDQQYESTWPIAPGVGYSDGDINQQWVPPFLVVRGGDTTTTGASTTPILAIVGLFAILIMPSIAQMTRDALKVEQKPYASAIGQAVGMGAAGVGLPIRIARQHKEQATQAERQAKAFAKYMPRNR